MRMRATEAEWRPATEAKRTERAERGSRKKSSLGCQVLTVFLSLLPLNMVPLIFEEN